MRNLYLGTLLSALTITFFAVPASAQDERVRLSIGTAATTGIGDHLALTASAGYRFLERLSFCISMNKQDITRCFFQRCLNRALEAASTSYSGCRYECRFHNYF